MKLAEGIHSHGFRKWYERELLQSHAHLALTFLCLVGMFAAFEAITLYHSMTDQLTDAATILICGGTGLWALRRYLFLLSHAEAVATQAECPRCGTFGRLDLLRSDASGEHVQVRCRRCGHSWPIDA